jgi:hypothetical protein
VAAVNSLIYWVSKPIWIGRMLGITALMALPEFFKNGNHLPPCGPDQRAWFGLGDVPSLNLLHLMVPSAERSVILRTLHVRRSGRTQHPVAGKAATCRATLRRRSPAQRFRTAKST